MRKDRGVCKYYRSFIKKQSLHSAESSNFAEFFQMTAI